MRWTIPTVLCMVACLGAGCGIDLSRHHDRLVQGNRSQRIDAAIRLRAYYGQSEATRRDVCTWYVEALGQSTGDEEKVVLLRSLCDYADCGDIVVKALQEQLERAPSKRVRMELASTLSRFSRPDAAATLARLLQQDNDAHVRTVAAAGLGRLGLHGYEGVLVRASGDDSPAVRRAAAAALASLKQADPTKETSTGL